MSLCFQKKKNYDVLRLRTIVFGFLPYTHTSEILSLSRIKWQVKLHILFLIKQLFLRILLINLFFKLKISNSFLLELGFAWINRPCTK